MAESPKVSIKELLKKINDRGNSRDERVQASADLHQTVKGLASLQDLPMQWKEIGDELTPVITSRSGPLEIKKNLVNTIGAIGAIAGWEFELFIYWLLEQIAATHTKGEEERALLISAAAHSINANVEKNYPFADKVSEKLMTFAISSLEANTSHQVHSSLMELCTAVARFSPTKFRTFFEDMVDLTVGWLMDETVPKKIHSKCEDALFEMSMFWSERPTYAQELLKHFRKDIAEDLEDLRKTGLTGMDARKILLRAAALIKTHAIIIRIYLAEPTEECINKVVINSMEEILQAGRSYIEIFEVNDSNPSKLFLALLDVFELLFELKSLITFEEYSKLVRDYCSLSINIVSSFMGASLLVCANLNWLTKVLTNVDNIEEVFNMSTLIIEGKDGSVAKSILYRTASSEATFKPISRLISALLSEKNMKTIQFTYSGVLNMIRDSMEIICNPKSTDSHFRTKLEIENATTRLFCLLQSLERLATVKNSFVMLMLRPNIFTFLVSLPLEDNNLLSKFPLVHHALLRLLHIHCESHDYFVVNSSWISAASPSAIHQNLTGKHAEAQLNLLTNLLVNGKDVVIPKTRKLCDEWMTNLFNFLPEYALNDVFKHKDFQKLKVALWTVMLENPKRADKLQSVIKLLEVTNVLDTSGAIHQVLEVRRSIQKLDRHMSNRLWKKIPARNYILTGVSIVGWDSVEMPQKKAMECRFSSEQFSMITGFLLHKQLPNLLRDENDNWMKDTIAYINSSTSNEEQEDMLMNRWRWALLQTVNYCIENRMRTQYGGPMETFSEFSKEIHRLAKEAITDTVVEKTAEIKEKEREKEREKKRPLILVRRQEKEAEEEENGEMKEQRGLNSSEDWWRIRLLLEFFDLLDKSIYSANTGCVFSPISVSETSRHFFIQNSNACQEWLSRTYISAMAVAFSSGAYAEVIRFGASAMQDFERKQKKEKPLTSERAEDSKLNGKLPSLVVVTLQWISKAMILLGYEFAVIGLAGWVERVYCILPEWIYICADIAAARWELALAKLRASLKQGKSESSESKFAREMIIFCILRLRLPELVSPTLCPPDLSMWDIMTTTTDGVFPDVPPEFEEKAFVCCRDLCSFGKVETSPSYSLSSWKLPDRTLHVEHTLLTTMRRPEVVDIENSMVNDAALILTTEGPLRLHTNFAVIYLIARSLSTRMQKKGMELADVHAAIISDMDPKFILSDPKSNIGERLALGRQLLLWTERLGGPAHTDSHVEMARLCRKNENRLLSASHLMRAASNPNYQRSPTAVSQILVATQGAKMLWPTTSFEQRAQHFVGLFSLAAKAFDLDLDHRVNGENFDFPNSTSSDILLQLPNGSGFSNNSQKSVGVSTSNGISAAKASLLLARWLEQEPQLFSTLPHEAAQLTYMNQLSLLAQEIGSPDWIGALLSMATKCAPTISKAHEKFANWILGQATMNQPMQEQQYFESNYSRLLGPEIATPERIDALWKAIFSCNNFVQLQNAVNNALGEKFFYAADILLKQTVYYTNLWGKMLTRRRQLILMSAASFFSFLRYQDASEPKSTIGSVRVCLQILELLAHHYDIVHDALDKGIATSDANLWISVLPQVFARLSHPSKKVRETLVELISRIGKVSPHAVIYQIVVGASKQMLVDAEADDFVETVDNEINENTHLEEKSLMFECCQRLEETLSKHYSQMVIDVRSFVEELQKINLLSEERWVFVLSNIDNEMEKRFTQIRAETERTLRAAHLDEKERIELVQEKTRLITNAVFGLLDDLYEKTINRAPVTVNETTFMDEYKEKITAAFKTSRANRNNPEKSWAPFRQLLAMFLQKTSKRINPVLHIENISEKLSKFDGSHIPIPGQERLEFSQIAYLQKLGSTAIVLPTKTRPKKLILIDSNGKENIFLFKGQEDLHLDERIMQLLHICNSMLNGSNKTRSEWPLYEARNYSVTPLGARSGLIQWVTGCTPLFHLYRKWQTRQNAIKVLLQKKAGNMSASNNETSDRPTDQFLKKLRLAFKENDITAEVANDRSKWPKTILRQVLLELMKETPNDLLSRELWMRAGSSDTWWRVTTRMARTTAVMSVIGAVLGLGDRHLDNLLVNLDSGQMVHIDYNVCFDKGRHLRVPETVPFRLTPNIVHALGPSQVDGMFRQSSKQVLEVLRAGKKVLLTVLDAFVYDPLVDWAAAQDHLTTSAASVNVAVALAVHGTDSRAIGARPIARQMFSVRIREYSTPWKENRLELSEAIKQLISTINDELKLNVQNPLDEAHILQKKRNEALQRVKAAVHSHHQLMKNFRQLLRALSASDERFSAYAKKYREKFADGVVKAHSLLDMEPPNLALSMSMLNSVLDTLNEIYDGLLALDKPSPVELPASAPIANSMAPPGLEDALAGEQQKQEQNLYARNVRRKVEARLDGRIDTSDSLKNVSTQEQVDYWIKSATSIANLALMYEGWTAWV